MVFTCICAVDNMRHYNTTLSTRYYASIYIHAYYVNGTNGRSGMLNDDLHVCSSAHSGCVVKGSVVMVAYCITP